MEKKNRFRGKRAMLRKIRSWLKDDNAVASIEFAMLAIPFCTLFVRTGEAADTGDPEGAFVTELCNQVDFYIPCEDIVYESLVLEGFSDADELAPEFDADGNMVSQGFDVGGSSDVVMV